MAPTNKAQAAKKDESSDSPEIKQAKEDYKKVQDKPGNFFKKALVSTVGVLFTGAALVLGRDKPDQLVVTSSQHFKDCLNNVCGGVKDCVKYPSTDDFSAWSKPYNRAYPFMPVAVVRPRDAKDVSGFVQCAAQNNVKVQAKSGGHSFANFGLGGEDGSLSIDLRHLAYAYFDKNDETLARIGGGSKLGLIDEIISKNKRVFPHGVCPGVGIGGHATIGGLGPLSRQYGATLDNIVEAQVVVANGSIVRASKKEHSDLFFAIRGAGASFGIVTEFVVKTYDVPKNVLYFTSEISSSNLNKIIDQFLQYQELIAEKNLDRRFACEFYFNPGGTKVTATWYGTQEEWDKTGIQKRIPGLERVATGLVASIAKQIENMEMVLSDASTEFYSRSLGLTAGDKLDAVDTTKLVKSIYKYNKASAEKWFVIFDATGGMVAEPPMDSTAYAHRDKVMFYQSYALNPVSPLTKFDKIFLNNIHEIVLEATPKGPHTTYPGYVDLELKDAQKIYWGPNLSRLQKIKTAWDPMDVFHNPQSVQPL